MKLIMIFTALNLFVFCAQSARSAGADDNWWFQIQKSNRECIVFITNEVTASNGLKTVTTGTGILVHPNGFILTCNHVVPKLREGETSTVTIRVGGREELPYSNKMTFHNEESDLALLRIAERPSKPWIVPYALATGTTGTKIAAIGFPLQESLVTKVGAIISTDTNYNGQWMTDASLNSGMSGGPVFDESGNLVGFVAGGYPNEQGMNLIIPVSFAKRFLIDIDSPLLTKPSLSAISKRNLVATLTVSNGPLRGQDWRASQNFSLTHPLGTTKFVVEVADPTSENIRFGIARDVNFGGDPTLETNVHNGSELDRLSSEDLENLYIGGVTNAKAPFIVNIYAK